MSDDTITITFTADELLDFIEALNFVSSDDHLDGIETRISNTLKVSEAVEGRIPSDMREKYFSAKHGAIEYRSAHRNLARLRGRLTE